MRRLLLVAAFSALAAACTKPCEELADRICECHPTGSSTETCKREVSNVIDGVDPTKGEEEVCSDLLDSCDAPGDADFCAWLTTAEGKAACGLAY